MKTEYDLKLDNWLLKMQEFYDLEKDECGDLLGAAVQDVCILINMFESGIKSKEQFISEMNDIAFALFLTDFQLYVGSNNFDLKGLKLALADYTICINSFEESYDLIA